MSNSGVTASVSSWLHQFTVVDHGQAALKDADPNQAQLQLSRKAIDKFEKMGVDDQLVALRQLNDVSRSTLLEHMSPTVRDKTIGGGDPKLILDVAHHDTGPHFEYDWSSFDFSAPPLVFNAHNAQGLAIMAKRAYEDFGKDGSDPTKVGQGFADFAAQGFELKFFGRSGSTQAFIATKGNDVIVSFRGTTMSEIEDVVTDVRFCQRPGFGGKVHEGFDDALSEVWDDMAAALNQLADQRGQLNVHVTGHSLGAALATMAAVKIDQLPDIEVRSVVPLGSPRLFDADAAQAYEEQLGDRTFRVVNNSDVVTDIPPAEMGFVHVGQHIYFDTKGRMRQYVSEDVVKADRARSNWDDGEMGKGWARGMPWSPAFSEQTWDHGPIAYVKHFHVNPQVVEYTPQEVATEINNYMERIVAQEELHASLELLGSLAPEQRQEAIAALTKSAYKRLCNNIDDLERRAYPEVVEELLAGR